LYLGLNSFNSLFYKAAKLVVDVGHGQLLSVRVILGRSYWILIGRHVKSFSSYDKFPVERRKVGFEFNIQRVWNYLGRFLHPVRHTVSESLGMALLVVRFCVIPFGCDTHVAYFAKRKHSLFTKVLF
jgi:hypothetical protein